MLISKANSLDKFERRLAQIVCAYNGEDLDYNKEDFIKYPEDFDTKGLAGEIDTAANLMTLNFPKRIRQEQAKMIVKEMIPTASISLQTELMDSLKDWPEDPVELAGRMAKATAQPDMKAGGTKSSPTKDDEKGIRRESRQGQVTKTT